MKLFVIGEDVYFSELSPYPFRSGAVTCATQRFDQFTLHARAVLGLPIDATLVTPGAIAFSNDIRPITRASVVQALNMPEIHVAVTQRGPWHYLRQIPRSKQLTEQCWPSLEWRGINHILPSPLTTLLNPLGRPLDKRLPKHALPADNSFGHCGDAEIII